jgi:hypothetical protein
LLQICYNIEPEMNENRNVMQHLTEWGQIKESNLSRKLNSTKYLWKAHIKQ